MKQVLIPYRQSLEMGNEKILLVLDGHGTHTSVENVAFCRANQIYVSLIPPHTSHVIQPLDIGIFNSYKAAYRQSVSNSSISDIRYSWPSEATQQRLIMLGRSLIANAKSVTKAHIRRAFFHSGIYPLSFEHFIYYCHNIRDVPQEVREHAKTVFEDEQQQKRQRLESRPRNRIVDAIVFSSEV